MNRSIDSFFASLQGKRIAVVGMGVSHFDLIRLFVKKELNVVVCDKRTPEQLDRDYHDNYHTLEELGVSFCLGEDYLSAFAEADIIFRTPGMYYYHPALMEAKAKGKVVTSEMEVFFELCPCPIYAVTGSDGKTTTTTLIARLLEGAGKRVHLGGNIGKALLPDIACVREEDVCVVELSSFQLISMRHSPDVAVITNMAPNHLDVHRNMEEYVDSKKNLLLHQNAFSKAVLNLDNALTKDCHTLVRGDLQYFSRQAVPEQGTYLDEDGYLCRVKNGVSSPIIHKDAIKIPGIHNVENYLAAIAAVQDVVSDRVITEVATTFGGVEHRVELVREYKGVRYYNDSIATSPTRTIAGLRAFDQKLIVIAGGYDKNLSYEPLAPVLAEKVKTLVLLGATAPKIEAAVLQAMQTAPETMPILHAESLEEAVQKAADIAESGDVVMLSPASASFDMYLNFEQRGKHFKAIVEALQ